MKKSLTIFLQIIIVVIGLGALALMFWEPTLEGRNASASLFEIYFKDPFLAYVYIASIAFFVALYQVFKVMGYVRQNISSTLVLKALRNIKYCAIILVCFILGAEAYLFIVQRGKDDIAGGVAVGLFMIVIFVVIATTTAMFERNLQIAADKNPRTT
jgi:uncharacterized membrane-anchored protein